MASVEYNLQQRKIGLSKYIEIYGIELLNKLAQERKGVDILEMNTTDLGNLKKTLDNPGFVEFIKTEKRLPTTSEGRSLGYQFSEIRAAEKLKNPPKVPADTSPVYNKAKGYIYKRGGGGGNQGKVVYAKTKGGNQFTAIKPMRSFEELQKAINNAPELKINGKSFKQNSKDITGTSVQSNKEIITPREALEYDGTIDEVTGKLKRKLIYPGYGRKQIEDQSEGVKKRARKIKSTQKSAISITGGSKIGQAFGHVYPIIGSYKPSSKITNLIGSKKNGRLVPYNIIGQKIAEDQEWFIKNKPQNYIEEIEKLNGKAKLNVNNAIKKLGPEYKGDIGYFQVDPETGTFKPKAGNYKKSFAGITGKDQIYYDMTSAERTQFGKNISDDAFKNKETIKSTLLKLNKPDLKKACRALGAFNVGGDVAGCAAAIETDPVKAATALEKIKPTSAALGKVRNAATSFLKIAGKGKVFGVTAAVGAGAGALVKKFMSDDPSTYLTNDVQANAMILDTIDEKERQERMEAIGDAPELLDEARIAGEVGVTAAAIPGSGAVYGARKKPFTRIVDGVKKTRPAMGTARAALGPVGKALSGFATPAGIAALTPLNVASSLYEGDSGYEIATDPLNYLAPAFAGTMGSLSKEATRGMGATSKLAKVLRLGMSPGAIKMVSRRFGLPGLALSSGISLYELADEYKSGRGMFGKKE